MAFIGNTNTTQAFTPAIDYFSGNGSTTAFTLSRPVASVAQVQVVVNNVAQNPSSAYTVSSNTITFTSAPSSGTNNIYVYYTSPITQVVALPQNPQVFGNLQFSSSGARITGDFSNATVANRVMFQTSTTNGNTVLNLIPNGTGTTCAFGMDSDPALTNSSTGSLNLVASTDVRLSSSIRGTGTYLPMTFYTGGSERMRVDTSGNVGIGTSSPSTRLHVFNSSATSTTFKANTLITAFSNANGADATISLGDGVANNAVISQLSGALLFGTGSGTPETMRIDGSGNLRFNSGYGSVATAYGCRAWVNFNGTGTVAIRSSGNVSSITDNGVGLYTVNFTNAMPDTNYATVGTCNFEVDVGIPFNSRTAATGSVGVETYRPYPYNTPVDVSTVSVAIFR